MSVDPKQQRELLDLSPMGELVDRLVAARIDLAKGNEDAAFSVMAARLAIDRGWPRMCVEHETIKSRCAACGTAGESQPTPPTGGDFMRGLLAAAPSLRHVDPARVKDDDYRPPAMLTIPDDETTAATIESELARKHLSPSLAAEAARNVVQVLRSLSTGGGR